MEMNRKDDSEIAAKHTKKAGIPAFFAAPSLYLLREKVML